MAWKATFNKGVACYRCGDFEGALTHMNQAVGLQSNVSIIYDSRAAVHEKLDNPKAALLDSRRVIELGPDRWQGYVRSARLFLLLGKYDSAIKMVDHALSRLPPEDVLRHAQMLDLREKAITAHAATEERRSSQAAQTSYLLGNLPVETLVQIFTVLIDEHHTWAVKLSHVCGHWRRILINAPSAWKTLVLSKKRPVEKVRLWKQRTKNRIARISVDMLRLDADSVFAELKDLSWDDLSCLDMGAEGFVRLQRMLSDIPHPFSNLSELALVGCGTSDQLLCTYSGANWNLRSLQLAGLIYMRDGWWQRIQQLRELRLFGALLRFSTPVFTANPLLEKFVVIGHTVENSDSNPHDDPSPTSMNNLKYVECQHPNPFPYIRAITTPSITHFTLRSIAILADATLLHIASHPSLVELHICNCSLSPSTLPALLFSTPNLETLRVNSVHAVVNEVLQFLTPKTTHDLPCRALRHVDVSRCVDLGTSSLYAFVKTRMQYASESVEQAEKCAVIASLIVDGCPKVEADMLPWFRSKVAQFSCIFATKKDFKNDRRRRPQL